MTKQQRQLRADIASAYAQNARIAELGYGSFGLSRRQATGKPLNTRRVACHPMHATQNRTLGAYRVPMSADLRAILAFAHRPLGAPRLVKGL